MRLRARRARGEGLVGRDVEGRAALQLSAAFAVGFALQHLLHARR
jgi:hypothetical protein